jgi:hypothetical protein
MEAAPIYCIDVDSRVAHAGVNVTLRRIVENGDERLQLVGAEGDLCGVAAVAGRNVLLRLRTMYPSLFFLDDSPNINYERIVE